MELLPEGTYRARGLSAALGMTAQNKEQVGIEFVLLDSEGTEGARMTYFGSFSEKALEHTIKALRIAGWTGDDLSDFQGIGTTDVDLVVAHEEYEGKWSAKIKWVNPAGSGGPALKAPMSPEQAKAFAARMKGQILGLERNIGTPRAATRQASRPAPGRPPEPRPHTDSDLPF